MLGRDDSDPLFLQLKEAQASVLEPFLGKSAFAQPRPARRRGPAADAGRQRHHARLDPHSTAFDGGERDFYMRQLWDGKGSALVDAMEPGDAGRVRPGLRQDAREGPRPLRRRGRDRQLPRRGRQLRPRAGDVRRDLRRPERARLPRARARPSCPNGSWPRPGSDGHGMEDMMSRASEPAARRPLWQLFALVVSWLAMGVALMVAAGLLPGVRVESFWGALWSRRSSRRSTRSSRPCSPRCGCRSRSSSASCSCCSRTPRSCVAADALTDGMPDRRQLRLGAARRAGGRRRQRRARGVSLGTRRHGLDPDREADRAPAGHHRPHRRPRDHLPRDRRARAARAAPRRCATATPRPWPAGWPTARTAWPSGRPISPRRPAPARPGSCSAPTRTSRRSAGSRRRPAR